MIEIVPFCVALYLSWMLPWIQVYLSFVPIECAFLFLPVKSVFVLYLFEEVAVSFVSETQLVYMAPNVGLEPYLGEDPVAEF